MKLKAMSSFKAKVVDPCTKLLSKFKHKLENPNSISSFRMPRRRNRPRIRTRVVRFRKPFSIKSLAFPQCGRPKTKILLKRRRPPISSRFKKALRFRRHRRPQPPPKKPVPKVRVAELLTVLFTLRKSSKEVEVDMTEESDQVTTTSVSEGGHLNEPFSSPITPAYLKHAGKEEERSDASTEEAEDLCRSFEKYLVEMVVEERKVKDLTDVEEVLYCWRNLKNPVFVELVCCFYGDLCTHLFLPTSSSSSQESQEIN